MDTLDHRGRVTIATINWDNPAMRSSYMSFCYVSADFGIAAQISQTLMKRKSFIGTPYW